MERKVMNELEPSISKFDGEGWSELPQELLEMTLIHLIFADHVRFAAVCTWWRSVATRTRHHTALCLPWMLRSNDDQYLSAASSPEDVNELHPIIPLQWNYLGCCEGWMVMGNTPFSGEIYLVNPLSGCHISLPSKIKFPQATRDIGSCIINKVVLSSSPLCGTCVLVASLNARMKLAFCRPSDDAWVLFPPDRQAFSMNNEDITFHAGLLYAVNVQHLVAYRFGNNPQQEDLVPEVVKVYNTNQPRKRLGSRMYLVWSVEKLFVAARYYRVNNGDTRLMFRVFVLDLERKELVKVKCLDDIVLFLADNYSRSYKVNRSSLSGGYSAGRIYYIGHGVYNICRLEEWGTPLMTEKRSWFVLN